MQQDKQQKGGTVVFISAPTQHYLTQTYNFNMN